MAFVACGGVASRSKPPFQNLSSKISTPIHVETKGLSERLQPRLQLVHIVQRGPHPAGGLGTRGQLRHHVLDPFHLPPLHDLFVIGFQGLHLQMLPGVLLGFEIARLDVRVADVPKLCCDLSCFLQQQLRLFRWGAQGWGLGG